MNITEEKQSTAVVLKPQGKLNSANSSHLEAAILRVFERGDRRVIVDLSDVPYTTSSGLRALLMGYKRLHAESGTFAVCSLPGIVARAFKAAGFHDVLPVFDNATQAVAALSGEATAS